MIRFDATNGTHIGAVSDEAPELMKLWEVEASLAELESFDPEVAQVQLEQCACPSELHHLTT